MRKPFIMGRNTATLWISLYTILCYNVYYKLTDELPSSVFTFRRFFLGFFSREKTYSRTAIMEAASTAKGKGKKKKAIAEYQKILAMNPKDHEVHARLAPLYAETKQLDDSWESFMKAANGFKERGFTDKVIGIYSQASNYMPHKRELWEMISDLKLKKSNPKEAATVLVAGRKHFNHKDHLGDAMHLLYKAWKLVPWDVDISMDLGSVLARLDKKKDAYDLFYGLAERNKGKARRRALWRAFRLKSSARLLWLWFRALVIKR